jgi:hypothetical protein
MRMQMRRFTRLTTGDSKKVANHEHMVALYTVWYNWIRTHIIDQPRHIGHVHELVRQTGRHCRRHPMCLRRVAALALPQSK